jgi:hypothetical protein
MRLRPSENFAHPVGDAVRDYYGITHLPLMDVDARKFSTKSGQFGRMQNEIADGDADGTIGKVVH